MLEPITGAVPPGTTGTPAAAITPPPPTTTTPAAPLARPPGPAPSPAPPPIATVPTAAEPIWRTWPSPSARTSRKPSGPSPDRRAVALGELPVAPHDVTAEPEGRHQAGSTARGAVP